MPFSFERAKLARAADIAGLEFHAQAQRLNHAAAHLKFQRIVTEQTRDGPDRCPE